MSTVIKIVCYTLLTTACIIAASVGVVAVQKYQSDVEKFDTIQSYNLNATCWLTSTTFSSQNGDCRIEEFQVSLMVGATSGWMPGFTAFSNFFSDSCGGVVYYTNVSGLDPNMTQLPCFYRSLSLRCTHRASLNQHPTITMAGGRTPRTTRIAPA